MTEPLETRRKRALFRGGHRGTRELDVLIGGFAARHVPHMTAAELDAFERLLTVADPDLYDWIAGRAAVPAAHDGPVMDLMRNFKVSTSTT